jgi:hypothetical protein
MGSFMNLFNSRFHQYCINCLRGKILVDEWVMLINKYFSSLGAKNMPVPGVVDKGPCPTWLLWSLGHTDQYKTQSVRKSFGVQTLKL